MRAKFIKDKLFENPNAIILPDVWKKHKGKYTYKPSESEMREYDQEGNVAFSYFGDPPQLLSGKKYATHWDLLRKAREKGIIQKAQSERGEGAGRMFTDQKVISFWTYPENAERLVEIIKDLEKETGVKIMDDPEWLIEIPAGEWKKALDDSGGSWGSWKPMVGQVAYIPIKDYKGGYTRSKEDMGQEHIKSPMQKLKRPERTAYMKYDKKKPLAWRQAMYAESFYPRLK